MSQQIVAVGSNPVNDLFVESAADESREAAQVLGRSQDQLHERALPNLTN